MKSLEGRTAVVTGAANGIGRGVARVLAGEGARVVIVDIDAKAAEAAATELAGKGLDAISVAADVTRMESMSAMAETVVAEFGRIDILVPNAGIYPLVRIAELDDSAWDRVMDVNVKGALHAVRACVPAMTKGGYGRIVLMSSITGPVTGTPGYAAYGASKAALLGMMRSLALELAPRGVTVNAVLPGNIMTEGVAAMSDEHRRQMLASIPMRAFGDPLDVGWAVRYLVSAEANYVTGHALVIDGGQILPESPESLDR